MANNKFDINIQTNKDIIAYNVVLQYIYLFKYQTL